jgi:hypothetical protein
MEGLEPPHLTASDPKSDVSTNFTTCAFGAAKVMDLDQKKQVIEKGATVKAAQNICFYFFQSLAITMFST